VKTYKDKDLASYANTIIGAQAAAVVDAASGRDQGTCVLGAGVAVWYVPPRCRNPVRKILIRAPFQGNVGSYRACERALKLLQSAGVDAFWYDGVID
jgi:hypothetical protein